MAARVIMEWFDLNVLAYTDGNWTYNTILKEN